MLRDYVVCCRSMFYTCIYINKFDTRVRRLDSKNWMILVKEYVPDRVASLVHCTYLVHLLLYVWALTKYQIKYETEISCSICIVYDWLYGHKSCSFMKLVACMKDHHR